MSEAAGMASHNEDISIYQFRSPHPTAPVHVSQPSVAAFVASIVRRRTVLLMWTLASFSLAVAYVKYAVPQFTSSALILIDQRSNEPLHLAPTITDALSEAANLESQVEIIRSDRTMQLVVEEQKLIEDPALKPDRLQRTVSLAVRKLPVWIRPALPLEAGQQGLIRAAAALQRRISVHRVGATFLIEIDATMPDPAQAAAIANSLVNVYIADQQRRREDLTRRQSELLQARSRELDHDVQRAEQAVEQLKFSGSLSDEDSVAAQVKLKDLQSLAQTYRLLHDKFLEQSAESWQQQFLAIPDATIASPAYPPLEKSSPRSLIIITCSLLIGVSLGSIVIALMDRRALGMTP